MTPRLTLLTSALFILTACSTEQSELADFHVEPRDQRRYQIVMSSEVASHDDQGQRYAERVKQTELRSYRITDSDPEVIRLFVQPDYLHAQADSGYAFGSVLGAMNQEDTLLLNALADGSELETAKGSGQAVTPLNRNYVNARRSLMGRLNQVQDQLMQPGLVSGMQLTPGATRHFESDSDRGAPAFTLRVHALSDDHVVFSVENGSDSIQMYGRMLVALETGWLIRAGIVMKSEFKAEDDVRDVRTTMTISDAAWPYTDLLQYGALNDLDIDFTSLPDNLEHLTEATQAHVFGETKGRVRVNGDRLEFEYEHPLRQVEVVGQFGFTDIRAFNQQGDPLELEFEAQRPVSYPGENEHIVTFADVFPLGWDDVESRLEQIHHIEAVMQWYPQTLHLQPIDVPQQGSSELMHGGAHARLETTDNPREFDLYFLPTPHMLFGIQVYGAEHGVLHSVAIEGGADWLSEKERDMLNVIQHGEFPTRTRLRFRNQVPRQLKLITYTIEQEPAAERLLQFELR